MPKIPNLFIVGAPKTATTTLYALLKSSPDVFMSPVKEPAYFCGFTGKKWGGPGGDYLKNHLVQDKDEYLSLFAKHNGQRYIGEASTDYLWVEEAPYRIKEFSSPNTKIIILLREHIDRVRSEHAHLLRDGLETLNIIQAIEEEDNRYKNNWQPLFYHYRRGVYFDGIYRYVNCFGHENVFVGLHEHGISKLMTDILKFLEIDSFPYPKSRTLNKSGTVRMGFINDILEKESIVKPIIKRLFGSDTTRTWSHSIKNMNLKKVEFAEEEKQYLRSIFQDDLSKLRTLPWLDLSEWAEKTTV